MSKRQIIWSIVEIINVSLQFRYLMIKMERIRNIGHNNTAVHVINRS